MKIRSDRVAAEEGDSRARVTRGETRPVPPELVGTWLSKDESGKPATQLIINADGSWCVSDLIDQLTLKGRSCRLQKIEGLDCLVFFEARRPSPHTPAKLVAPLDAQGRPYFPDAGGPFEQTASLRSGSIGGGD